jgi:excisionase family DNA binding protein
MASMDTATATMNIGPVSDRAGVRPRALVDRDELAARLGVSERFVRRLVEERRIPYLKLGRFVRFDPVEIDRWLMSQRVEPRSAVVALRRHWR